MSATCDQCRPIGFDALSTRLQGVTLCPRHAAVEALEEVVRRYQVAAAKFINKVKTGRAQSVETYADLTDCFERGMEALDAARQTKEQG